MTVYVVIDNDVQNPEEYKEYISLVAPTVNEYGGRYLVRAGNIRLADSKWRPERLVIIAFDELERAREWVESEALAHIHELRRANAKSRLVIVDGVDVGLEQAKQKL